MKILNSKILGDSKKDLFILHGFLGMGDNWKTHAKIFSENNYRVHLIDLRNHGKSFWSKEFSFEIMAQDILNYAKNYKIEKFSLLGHSMGGNLAMLISQKSQNLIDKMIIVDIVPKYYKPHHNSILESLKTLDFNTIRSRKEAEAHVMGYINDHRVIQFLLKNLTWVDSSTLGLKLNIDVLCEFQDKLSLILDENKVFDNPTLFLYGEDSDYVNSSDITLMKTFFKNIEIHEVPNSGHWLHVDNPTYFLNKTINFLNN